jgi:D-glycero-alpha-D-manno-heptose-7-phosphate kinase
LYRTTDGDAAMIDNLHFIKELGSRIKMALERGDTEGFGRMMHEHWEARRGRAFNMSNSAINRWYQTGRDAGALGGKMVGAGGGGFLLFYTLDRTRLRAAMARPSSSEV